MRELQGYQREDFEGIFRVMRERPVTIRLLDPPLHEFLPERGSPAYLDLVSQVLVPSGSHWVSPIVGIRNVSFSKKGKELNNVARVSPFVSFSFEARNRTRVLRR